MDPSSIAPATNTVPMPTISAVVPPPITTASAAATFPPEEAAVNNNHVAPSANANPSAAPAPNHPPYAEMIFNAISALKEKNGSSKRAIAKFIEQAYRDLPPTHSALLTHHLKRLKNNGLLVMVKKSYTLPRSDAPAGASTSSTQRSRGRPPKPKPQPQPQLEAQPQSQLQYQLQQQLQLQQQQFQLQPPLQPLLQPQPQPVPVLANAQQNAEPMWVALGLSDEPVTAEVKKRGPGRPRKIVEGVGQPGSAVRRERPPGPRTGPGRPRLTKRRGRPPKPKSVLTISNGLKRRPGRPPKIQSKPMLIPFAAPAPSGPTVPMLSAADGVPPTVPPDATVPIAPPRPRGRPRKNVAAMPAQGAPLQPVVGTGRGRGRGRGVLPGMRLGRLPNAAGVGRPKNPTGRPVGRPRKDATSATSSQKIANEDLRSKLEYFQSKVKESLSMIKPHFNHESPVTAIAAIQELEILATLDLNAPLGDETQQLPQIPPAHLPPQQQPVPQLQQLLQPQIFQQQLPPVHLQPELQQPFQPQPQQLFQPQASAPS